MNLSPVDLVQSQCLLGEGPNYDRATDQVLWVDVIGGKLHILELKSKNHRVFEGLDSISIADSVPNQPGKVAVAISSGVYILDLATGDKKLLAHPETRSGYCYNDGKFDSHGRLWVGSFDVGHNPPGPGSLWVIHPDGTYQEALNDLELPNGMAWSKDGKTMYLVDTTKNSILTFDFDAAKGSISNRKVLVVVVDPKSSGSPDGMEISKDGKILLVAQNFGGSGVYLYDAATGKFLTKLGVPAPNVSSCHWGGEHSDDLYVTCMRIKLTEQQQKDFPESGDLFVFKGLAHKLTELH